VPHPVRQAAGGQSAPAPLPRCQATAKRSFSPLAELLPERTAPELLYLETKWATLMSFEETRDLLGEVLPVGEELNVPAIRLNVHKIAERMEQALGEERQIFLEERPAREDGLPEPVPPLTVGLDGAYVHNRDQQSRQEGWFEVVTGKSLTATGEAKCFAFVLKYNPKPRRRLYEVLKSQGLQSNTPLTFLSDGEETMRNLQLYLGAPSEHWLDWFHITKRLTVMGQMRKGMQGIETPALVSQMEEELESLKWNLWNGNVLPALRIVDGLEVQLAGEQISEKRMKLLKAVREIGAYIRVNRASIPDYGDRFRNQELISTAFVESTVNQVVSKRMEKSQQMRWTPRGAHLLLQVRTRVLNGELRQMFCQWYPGMQSASVQERNLAAVA
jgi:hypothetical protein